MVLKIDVEGYDAALAGSLARLELPRGSVALVELHPEGFNGLGAPHHVLDSVSAAPGRRVKCLDNRPLYPLDAAAFHQIEIHRPE